MGLLTKEQIFGKKDIAFEEVKVPEWAEGDADTLLVWDLGGDERDEYEASLRRKSGDKTEFSLVGARSKLVALTVRDEGGKRIFEDHEIIQLGRKSSKALQRLYEVAARRCGLSKDSEEELVKNSSTAQSGGTGSDSPGSGAAV